MRVGPMNPVVGPNRPYYGQRQSQFDGAELYDQKRPLMAELPDQTTRMAKPILTPKPMDYSAPAPVVDTQAGPYGGITAGMKPPQPMNAPAPPTTGITATADPMRKPLRPYRPTGRTIGTSPVSRPLPQY